MSWTDSVSYFSGGLFLGNAIPHLVSSQTGRPCQSAFAGPLGEKAVLGAGECALGGLQPRGGPADAGAAAGGGLLVSVHSAGHFCRFHGGNDPN